LNKTINSLSVLLAVFVIAGLSIQSGVLQTYTVSCALSDDLAYEGAQGCVDEPSQNDDPTSLASVLSGEAKALDIPFPFHSLLSQFPSFRNSHQLPFSLRC
jgi:hypothetical protein